MVFSMVFSMVFLASAVHTSVGCPSGPDNCYHPDWAVKCSCAADSSACHATDGYWQPSGCSGSLVTEAENNTLAAEAENGCPSGPDNCYHPNWAVKCSCATDASACHATDGFWQPGCSGSLVSEAENKMLAVQMESGCPSGPDNCYHPDWAVKCSCATDASACHATDGFWQPGCSASLASEAENKTLAAEAESGCPSGPDNCYHPNWAVKCSCATDASACHATDGFWQPGCSGSLVSEAENKMLAAQLETGCPSGPGNCHHPDWAVKCSCAVDSSACHATDGYWQPSGCSGSATEAETKTLAAEAETGCPSGPDNCYHPNWAVKCSCATDASACHATDGFWQPGCSGSFVSEAENKILAAQMETGCPSGPDNCYHPNWAVKCSCATDASACHATDGFWQPGCSGSFITEAENKTFVV